MKLIAFAVCSLGMLARGFAAETPAAIAPTARIDLFNGRDLSGWTFCLRSNAAPENTWTVTNGLIYCTGQPFGYMRTEKNYRDYKLTVEWRFVKVAPRADNTGLFVHVQSPDKVWPVCIECQGQSHHHGDLILMGTTVEATRGSTNSLRVLRTAQPHNEKPVGDWNTYEVVCAGDALKVSVNGKLMNEAAGSSVSSGAIALQSEGGEWEVRKVFLEPLPK